MLTPKEKAEALFIENRAILSLPNAPLGEMKDELAIEFAIKEVGAIIQVTYTDPYDRKNNRSMFDKQYWQEVKSELEKL